MGAFFVHTLLLLIWDHANAESINIAALFDINETIFSHKLVKPAFDLAFKRIQNLQIIPRNYHFRVTYADSRCDGAMATNEMIRMYYHSKLKANNDSSVHAFFGPVCDFAAGPVHRQLSFWNIAMLTPGALAVEFNVKGGKPLLTRLGATIRSLSLSVVSILNHFKWRKVKTLYEPFTQTRNYRNKTRLCHILADGLDRKFQAVNVATSYHRLDGNTSFYYRKVLQEEVGTNYSGKCCFLICSDTNRCFFLALHAWKRGWGKWGTRYVLECL